MRLALRGAGDGALQPIGEQLAIGQPGQAVVHRIVHQPFMRPLEARHVAHQADAAQQPHILVRRSMRPEVVPKIGAVMTAQAKIGLKIAALLLLERPEHEPEALAVGGVHMLEEVVDRDVERAGVKAELHLDLIRHRDEVAARMPLEDMGARAIDGERFHLHEAGRPETHRAAAGAERELRDGEAEQNDDEHEAGDEA